MNKTVMLIILIGMNLFIATIDLVWAGIFLLLWPFWFMQNEKVIADEH